MPWSKSINYLPIQELQKKIEKLKGQRLANRGEAHITVLTPPLEGHNIEYYYSITEIVDHFWQKLSDLDFEVKCLGYLSEGQKEVYFLVVGSPDILAVRQEIIDELENRQAPAHLLDKDFFPHITVGFTGNDIHDLSKGPERCLYSIKWID